MYNYELSGTSEVLISATSECVIGNKHYNACDPITYMKDVKSKIYFSRNVKSSHNSSGVLAGTYTGTPQSLVLYGVKMKESVMNLISVVDTEEKHLYPQFRQMIANQDGKIALPTVSNKKIENFRIFKKNLEKLEENSYEIDLSSLVISGLKPKESYRIFYYEVKTPISSYYLTNNNVPNLKIELITTGQRTTETGEGKSVTAVYTIFNAKLVTAPDKDLSIETIDGVNLEFLIINNGINKKPVRIEYYGD